MPETFHVQASHPKLVRERSRGSWANSLRATVDLWQIYGNVKCLESFAIFILDVDCHRLVSFTVPFVFCQSFRIG